MEVMLDQRSLRSLTKVLKLFTLLRQASYELRLDLLDCVVHNGCVLHLYGLSRQVNTKKAVGGPGCFAYQAFNLQTTCGLQLAMVRPQLPCSSHLT